MIDITSELTIKLPMRLENSVTYIQMTNHSIVWSEGYRILSHDLFRNKTMEIFNAKGEFSITDNSVILFSFIILNTWKFLAS